MKKKKLNLYGVTIVDFCIKWQPPNLKKKKRSNDKSKWELNN